MARILESTEVRLEPADILRRTPLFHPSKVKPRSSGVHLTAVLKYILVTSKLPRWQNYVREIEEDDLPLRMALGIAWEEFIASFYAGWVWQPGEEESDGVFGTCDGYSCSIDVPVACGDIGEWSQVLEEAKYTAKKVQSDADFLADWYWMMQGKGYCRLYGARVMRWHVCYYNGNYNGGGPVYLRRTVAFEEAEIEAAWRAVEQSKDKAVAEVHG